MKKTANIAFGIMIITMVTLMPLQISSNTEVVEVTTTKVTTTNEKSLLDSVKEQANNAYEKIVEIKNAAKEKLTS